MNIRKFNIKIECDECGEFKSVQEKDGYYFCEDCLKIGESYHIF